MLIIHSIFSLRVRLDRKQQVLQTFTSVYSWLGYIFHIEREASPTPPPPPQQHERDTLKWERDKLNDLANHTVPYKEKKKLLVQHEAGFIDELLKSVLTALAYAII